MSDSRHARKRTGARSNAESVWSRFWSTAYIPMNGTLRAVMRRVIGGGGRDSANLKRGVLALPIVVLSSIVYLSATKSTRKLIKNLRECGPMVSYSQANGALVVLECGCIASEWLKMGTIGELHTSGEFKGGRVYRQSCSIHEGEKVIVRTATAEDIHEWYSERDQFPTLF